MINYDYDVKYDYVITYTTHSGIPELMGTKKEGQTLWIRHFYNKGHHSFCVTAKIKKKKAGPLR